MADCYGHDLDGDAHGGNLAAARRAFPQAPEPWLDLSTGVNPHPYPVADLPLEAFARLPDGADLARLERAAALAYGARSPVMATAAPGTQAIINWLPFLFPARRVGILDFTYGEHARRWRASGAEVMITGKIEQLAEFDAAVVVNPNNPDGRLIPAGELLRLAAALRARGGVLIVDEAFIDFLPPAASLVPVLPEGAIVLRSFGKTFGLAGLRLGFAIAPEPMAERLRAALGPWPVSGAAIETGGKALADAGWIARAGARLAADGTALDALLSDAGFQAIGDTLLFRLVRHENAQRLFGALGQAGILARRFAARPDWLRFGIPADDAQRERLRSALAQAVVPPRGEALQV
ncbi:cobalamin biosynthetic protein CobC [Methylocapsa palsarum]|uniref:threonine-phosphate decarboxylase n=1 Tax=Methylocapsa palsarum TaxID=1612308 RepID=A0A1I4BZH3_9HYPH|nr:cobalamin biosynthetic protein CobC [Methylocapsa palsarum]